MANTSAVTIGPKDYISHLDENLIDHIFSFLPTRDVIKTSVLSKTWKSLWTTMWDLSFFVSSDYDPFVDKVLKDYELPKVRKFHLDVYDFCNPSKVDSWVRFAINHQVEDLLLNITFCFYAPWEYYPDMIDYTLYPLLYNCSSLTKLCLRGCCFSSCESISWSSLKSLSIEGVNVDVLPKILMGSPVLEHLNLTRCWGIGGIHSASLTALVIDDTHLRSPLHISTLHLLSLHVRFHFHEVIRIIEAPSLVEAKLDFDGPAEPDYFLLKEMLCKLQNATRILLGAWCLRVMALLKVKDVNVSLLNCKILTLKMPICQFSFPAIGNMLATAPHLEKLVIIFESPDFLSYGSKLDCRNVDHGSYWHIKKKFKCWARHLKNVEIFGFNVCLRFKYEEVLMMIKFLLGHASVLENMVINVENNKSQQDVEVLDSCKLVEVAQRLESYHRASKHAAVILNYLEEGHRKRPKKKKKEKELEQQTKCLLVGHKNARLYRNTVSYT